VGVIDTFQDAIRSFEPASVLDILAIAALIYLALLLLRGTTAMSLIRGIAILLVMVALLARVLDLTVVNWIFRNSFPALLIAIPIIFQPEIRRFLERVGRTGRWPWPTRPQYDEVIDIIIEAGTNMAQRRHGALIVLERDTGLQDYIDTGLKLDAEPSARLLEGIFYPNSVLHDGAVILREDRVLAAGCTLPLSGKVDREHPGLRHRAALGTAELTDAVAIVVSEETGTISMAAGGRMISQMDGPRLRAILRSLLVPTLDMDRPTPRRLPRLIR
jgi:diadenylate cyclase